MKRTPAFSVVAAATAVLAIACTETRATRPTSAAAPATPVRRAEGAPSPPGGPPASEAVSPDPQKAWSGVLARFVDSEGRIDFSGLSRERAQLDAYVAWIGRVSPANTPSAFPNKDGKLTYYINAYNALALRTVLDLGAPRDLGPVRSRLFQETRSVVGGESLTLDDIENKIIGPIGDPRVHFALNCMARGCPRLPREPFRADQLPMELEAVAQFFLNADRNVQIDAEKQTVRLSRLLEDHADDFRTKAPSLTAYVNKFRESKIPDGARVEILPFDWALNAR